jgi:hypothetical protein
MTPPLAESHLSFTNFPLRPPTTMIRFLVLLSLLIVGTCLADTLSTGEDVTAFVRSKIDDHDVSLVVWSSQTLEGPLVLNYINISSFASRFWFLPRVIVPIARKPRHSYSSCKRLSMSKLSISSWTIYPEAMGPLSRKNLCKWQARGQVREDPLAENRYYLSNICACGESSQCFHHAWYVRTRRQ